MTQPAWSTLRATYSQHRVSAQNLGSCWCPLTLHPEHCCSCFSPLKRSQDATMSSGTKVVPGVPEGRGRITRGQLDVEASRVCHFFFGSDYHLPLFYKRGSHEKAQMSRGCLAKHDQDATNSKCKHHY